MILGAMSGVVLVQGSAVFAAWLLRAREVFLRRYLPLFVSLAVGVLLATALLHLMPEAIGTLGNAQPVWMLMGATLMVLFCGERISYVLTGAAAEPEVAALDDCPGCPPEQHGHDHHHDHSHHHAHEGHTTHPSNIVAASMLHSFIDGAAVATAFAANPRIGWLTAFAIALHEIPHRMGDFALFVHLQVPPARALRLALLAGAPSLLGVGAVALVGLEHADRIRWLLPISAGSFLYIAMVNLLPEIRQEKTAKGLAAQIACLCAGIALVIGAGGIFPS
ncbi:zinc and cadmium transporter [Granulicella rosea]|uniref:Zinc and cadmium transporter n=1 Tax=Granulicella rosea TaxID=474952 RepID=A0A239EVU6_9BACT|nr:ZIP family metal transporter [Granulicella rosea]SNS48153.1 zinc and cadmium transporter [Granulicella rosea]